MEEERKRIKRAEVSDETRSGRKRAAVNPNARQVGEPAEDTARDRLAAKVARLRQLRGGDAS